MSKISKEKVQGSSRGGLIPLTRTAGSDPSPSATGLPSELTALFAGVEATRLADVEALTRAAAKLDTDPEFLADYAKGLIVEDVLRALEISGLTKNALAKKIGTSRQYLSKVLDRDRRVNFTIETLAELAAAMKLQLCVRLLPSSERMLFLRKVTVPAHVEPVGEFPDQQEFVPPEDASFVPRNVIPFAAADEQASLSA